jgi:chorismate mutase / prephenate dehydratase
VDRALPEARGRIDALDRELLHLVARRLTVATEIGAAKGDDRPVVDPERERDLAAAWRRNAAEARVPYGLAAGLLREVLDGSRRCQAEKRERAAAGGYRAWVRRVGYQGEPGAHSELALRRLLGPAVEAHGHADFPALLDALARGAIDAALLPVENSISGAVPEAGSLLVEHPVAVLDEEVWRVEHCLAVLPGTPPEAVRRVRSHPVALQQCRRSLSARGLRQEIWFDTAGAAASLHDAGDPSVGALCSAEAAERHGLDIAARNLEDHPENRTRFFLLVREDDPRREPGEPPPALPAKTALVVVLANRPGALAGALGCLSEAGVNLTRIESRPRPGAPREYLFLLELEGDVREPRVARALGTMRSRVRHLRLLGSFPDRRPPAVSPDPVEPAVEAPAAAGPGRLLVPDSTEDPRRRVDVGGVEIGPGRFVVIAGPCAVEGPEQIRDAARMVAERGGAILRGGAFKPRTSPRSFQGLGHAGVDLLVAAGREQLLPVVTEVLDVRHLARIAERADMLQVGTRNMQNFELLKELGKIDRPGLLKRGMSATLDELLAAADYVLSGGNQQVVLCERGIRTFETSTRATLDLSAVPVLRSRTGLPVIVDPSHAAGRRELVIPLALAAAAAGADGLLVEVHPRPEEALCDRDQALGPDDLAELMARLRPIVEAQGRSFACPTGEAVPG